jgi:GTP cyclohydrolase I
MPPAGEQRLREIAKHVRAAMQALELDLDDPNLSGTPDRVAELFTELFAAAGAQSAPRLESFPNADHYAQMVSVTNVPFYSVCPHHLLPFFGRAHVAYIPRERIAGFGELARVVHHYTHKPQLQEQLCEQVASCLERELQPAGAMVLLQARHLCMEMRGEHTSGALATTCAVRGAFADPAVRDELLRLVPDAPR